jgi:hypothetical protein
VAVSATGKARDKAQAGKANLKQAGEKVKHAVKK